jgi:hypothetical protein
MMIHFFMRHEMLEDAIRYAVASNIHVNQFWDDIIHPTLKKNRLSQLLQTFKKIGLQFPFFFG